GVALGFAINSVIVLAQQFWGVQIIPQLTEAAGLFFNRNVATEGAGMALMLAVGYRLWWLIPGIAPTLIWGSRAPMVALGCGLCLWAWPRSRWLALGLLVGCASITWFWLQTHGGPIKVGAPFDGVTYTAGPFDTLEQRLDVWYDALPGLK